MTKKNIALDGKAKNLTPPTVHDGMHRRLRNGDLITGRTDQHIAASGGLIPATNGGELPLMQSVHPGKIHTQPAVTPGHRHRCNDSLHSGQPGENHARNAGCGIDHALGERVLDDAYNAGSHADRAVRRRFVPFKRG